MACSQTSTVFVPVQEGIGRDERGEEEGSASDGWDDEEEELRAQLMEAMGSPLSAMLVSMQWNPTCFACWDAQH